MEPNTLKTRATNILQMGVLLLGPFLLGSGLLVLFIGAYLWLDEPTRLASKRVSETRAEPIKQQPQRISPTETSLVILPPKPEAYLNGLAAQAALWVNGIAFKSSWSAFGEILVTAWPLWLLCAATLAGAAWLKRDLFATRAPPTEPGPTV